MAERQIDPKAVERACQRIGGERLQQRQDLVEAWLALPLVQRDSAPDGVEVPDLAVAGCDGGRLQIRPDPAQQDGPPQQPGRADPAPADPARAAELPAAAPPAPASAAKPGPEGPPGKGRCWREDKVGVLACMASATHQADPCPELPEVFREPLVVLKLAREVGRLEAVPEPGPYPKKDRDGTPTEAAPAEEETEPAAKRPGRPKVLSRRVLASRQCSEAFGPMLAATAWSLGLFAAARRAFLGDGAEYNWTIQKTYFARWTPILDFIHVLSYVFGAALAGRSFEEGWATYQEWISWTWKGEIETLLGALRARLVELGVPAEQVPAVETRAEDAPLLVGPAQAVGRCLGYVKANQSRMRYAEYRREGLPIMSSLLESTVKQISRRLKGTEKFWSEEGAEALLQLRADYISDAEPLEDFWQQRPARMTGQRPRHKGVA